MRIIKTGAVYVYTFALFYMKMSQIKIRTIDSFPDIFVYFLQIQNSFNKKPDTAWICYIKMFEKEEKKLQERKSTANLKFSIMNIKKEGQGLLIWKG